MTIKNHKFRNLKLDRTGAALVEFAIVAPIFLLIVFASIEIIQLNMIKKLVQEAAYFSARDAMVPGASIEEAQVEPILPLITWVHPPPCVVMSQYTSKISPATFN